MWLSREPYNVRLESIELYLQYGAYSSDQNFNYTLIFDGLYSDIKKFISEYDICPIKEPY